MDITNCLHCQKEFKFRKSQSFGKYCSNKCRGDFLFSKTIEDVKSGIMKDIKTMKRVLIHLHGYQCKNCNISSWMNSPISLQTDHIDGNSDNNLLENLRLLCPNCHSQTETFCARNFKNTKRANYNQRYRRKKLNI